MANFNISIDLKQEIISLLNDADVKEKILEIGNNSWLQKENIELKTKNEELSEEIKKLRGELEEVKSSKSILGQENTALKENENDLNTKLEKANNDLEKAKSEKDCFEQQIKDISTEKANCEKDLINYKNKLSYVSDIVELQEQIDCFKADTIDFLDELAGGNDLMMYLFVSRRRNSIKQLWDFISDKAVSSERDDIEINALGIYFDYIIRLNNQIQEDKENNKFIKIEVNIGDSYNSDYAIKTSESILNGKIERILVNGYWDSEGGYDFKAIVIVK